MKRQLWLAIAACAASPLVACSAIWGFQDVSLESGDGGATGSEGGAPDAGSDTLSAPDGGSSDSGAADSASDATGPDAAPQVLATGVYGPGAIAIDSTYIYYAVVLGNTIARMAKDGTGNQTVASSDFVLGPSCVASDGTNFYFTDQITTSADVYACPVAGCGTSSDVPFGTFAYPTGITVANGVVYWTDNGTGNQDGTVNAATPSGTGHRVLYTATDNSAPEALAVDGDLIYFTDNTNGSLRRVQTDGGGLVDLTASNEPPPSLGVAIGANAVFFTTMAAGNTSAVWSYDKSDGGVDPAFATGQVSPLGIATDANNVYWVNSGSQNTANGSIVMCPQSGCPTSGPIVLASGQAAPYGIAVDDNYIYWTNSGIPADNGSVLRLPKP